MHSMSIVHRNLKLCNILLHFPDETQLDLLPVKMKLKFLQHVDLTSVAFNVKIADFGFARVLDDSPTELSFVGTPLY